MLNAAAQEEIMPASQKALFIEDNEHAALAGAAMLETCGFEVLHVLTAEDGLEAFQSRPFDLVLSDICLPGKINGVELAAMIRRQRPDMRIILATGYSDQADMAARDFIVLRKPYDMSQFRAAVRNASSDAGG